MWCVSCGLVCIVLTSTWLGTTGQVLRTERDISSYGAPSAPLSTSYGVPLADPLDSYGAPAEDIIDQYSEASEAIFSDATESDMTSDEMNLKMLMTSVPGVPGEDYPILADVNSAGDTGFSCQGKIVGGYYADPSPPSRCQIFNVCTASSSSSQSIFSFLCPNGTVFNQAYFICDWWFNVDCQQAESLYVRNQEVKEEQERVASASSQYQQFEKAIVNVVVKEQTIYTAIEAANDKYGAPSDEGGSGDKDPIDPAYGVTKAAYTVQPIPTGYGVPRGEPLSVYHPPQGKGKRTGRKTKTNISRKLKKTQGSHFFLL